MSEQATEKDIQNSGQPEVNNPASTTANEDLSKVKIRSILAQRLKKSRPSFKKALPFILVAIISFAIGIGADRLFMRGTVNRIPNNRPNIQRKFQDNRNNKNSNNFKNFKNGPGA